MNLFKRKHVHRSERIVLATQSEVSESIPSPLDGATRDRPAMTRPAARADNTRLKELSDLELFGAFVVSRGKGDRSTMATVQQELENRGKADELVHL